MLQQTDKHFRSGMFFGFYECGNKIANDCNRNLHAKYFILLLGEYVENG